MITDPISVIRADDTGLTIANETAGLSVLYHTLGPGVVFLRDVPIRPNLSAPFTLHQITVTGQIQTTNASGWDLQDDTSMRLHPTPEPASVVLLGMTPIGLVVTMRRRRQK